jgi:hypothetical protein
VFAVGRFLKGKVMLVDDPITGFHGVTTPLVFVGRIKRI